MSVPIETRCPDCGRTATAADRFCGHCGARLEAERGTPPARAGDATGAHRPHADRILAALRSATMGEYDIAGELGRGGMAMVFLAHDLSLNRKVAIKVLLPELLYTEGMDRRFKHEARIAAKLDHPNILVIHGVREANDLLFIVMKLVEGLPLSAMARVAGPLPVPVVRFVVRHVADALAYAHGEGVIHRDVKPANIMVDRRGNVIVMDFGIAKAADDAHLTRTGLVIGTPAYMSPEQCLAQGVAPASDQYSLGVVAYELLTGRTPFRGSALEMQWAHATTGAPALRTLRPDCPPELEALVMRMLAKTPADRWPSLHDVAAALGDDATTAAQARAALVALVSDGPGQRDAALPTTPASPIPIGVGPAVAGEATTDPVAAPMLTLSQQRIELATGDSVELVVELESGDHAADGAAVQWESSDPAVAAVSRDGIVTAVAPGLAEIACAWRGKRAVCAVHVSAAALPAAPVPTPVATAIRAPGATAMASVAEPVAEPVAARAATLPRVPRKRWWVGAIAAGLLAAAVYRGTRPTGSELAVGPVGSATAANSAAVPPIAASPIPAPPVATVPVAPDSAPVPNVEPPHPTATEAPAGTRQPPSRAVTTPRPATSSSAAARVDAPAARTTPPTVPLARPDTARRVSINTDSGAGGYPPTRSATPSPAPPTPPQPTSSAPAYPPPAAGDTTVARLPTPTPDIANQLASEFAVAINRRVYSRITTAYSQPSDPAAIALWQDFLIFVRDYMPRAVVRSVAVDTSTNPATITVAMNLRWSTDAGFDRTRPVSFVGLGVATPGGWQLLRVRLERRFW